MQEQARAPTAQQQLVLDEKRLGLAMVDQARYNLDARAMALLQAAGLILVLVGLVQVLNGGPSPGPLPAVVITIVALAFTGMIGLALAVIRTRRNYFTPGTLDWDKLQTSYLLADFQDCYNRILNNTIEAHTLMERGNRRKGQYLTWTFVLLAIQIVSLLVLVLAG